METRFWRFLVIIIGLILAVVVWDREFIRRLLSRLSTGRLAVASQARQIGQLADDPARRSAAEAQSQSWSTTRPTNSSPLRNWATVMNSSGWWAWAMSPGPQTMEE